MELKRFVNILRFSQQIKLVEAFMLGGLFLFADIILTVCAPHSVNRVKSPTVSSIKLLAPAFALSLW